MPKPFAITAVSNSVFLDDQRKGEARFTVSNQSGRSIEGRARVVTEEAAAESWVSLRGSAHREFSTAGTEQYTVEIEVPPEAPSGSYTVRLDMVGEERPDEQYVEGPAVTFEVPEAEPTEKPFPTWIVLGTAGAFLLGVIVVFWCHIFGCDQRVTGTVTDAATGEPIVGAAVVVAETTTGTTTDLDGTYNLEVPDPEDTLVVSFVGYQEERIAVGDQETINVELAEVVELEFTLIGRGIGIDFDDFDSYPTEDVIRDEDQWNSLWQNILEEIGEIVDEIPEPPVDFTKEMIIRASREVNVAGFGPQFEKVQRFPEKIVAHYTHIVVGEDCNGPSQDARTFTSSETIAVPQSDLEVQFETREIDRCPVQVPDVKGDNILEAIKQLDDRSLGWDDDVLYGRYDEVPAGHVVTAGHYEWVPPGEVLGLIISIGPPQSSDPRSTDELLEELEAHRFLLRDGSDLRLDTTAIRQEL